MNDNAKIGTALLGLGCLFIVLGVIFFFDRMFLSLGNVMFLGGLLLTMGVSQSTLLREEGEGQRDQQRASSAMSFWWSSSSGRCWACAWRALGSSIS